MASKNVIVELSRKQLYDEIWEISVAGVARKYNLHYAELIKACRDSSIPFPSSGYWTKRKLGKDVSSEAAILEGDPSKLLRLATNDSMLRITKKEKREGDDTVDDSFIPIWDGSGIIDK